MKVIAMLRLRRSAAMAVGSVVGSADYSHVEGRTWTAMMNEKVFDEAMT